MDRDHVARLGQIGGPLDGAKRGRTSSRVGVVTAGGNVKLGGIGGGNRENSQESSESGFHFRRFLLCCILTRAIPLNNADS